MFTLFKNSLTNKPLHKWTGDKNLSEATVLIECPHALHTPEEVQQYKYRIALSLQEGLIPILTPQLVENEETNDLYLKYAKYLWSWNNGEVQVINGQYHQLSSELKIISQSKQLIGLFSSGSTGEPKLVWQSIDNYKHAAMRSTELLRITSNTTALSALPCYHNGGFLNLVRQDLYPHNLHIVKYNDLIPFWKKLRPDLIIGVPTQLQQALNEIEDLSRQSFYCGGAALNHNLWNDALERGMKIFGTYGLSESCGAILYKMNPHEGHRPLKDVEVSLSDQSTLQFNCPSNACAIQRNNQIYIPQGPWITADMATIDSQGKVFINARADQTIISSGENIDPKEIENLVNKFLKENHISTHFQVLGMPDPIKGAVPIIMIEGLELWKSERRDNLIAYLRRGLSPLKKPRFLIQGISPEKGIKVTPFEARLAFDRQKVGIWKV